MERFGERTAQRTNLLPFSFGMYVRRLVYSSVRYKCSTLSRAFPRSAERRSASGFRASVHSARMANFGSGAAIASDLAVLVCGRRVSVWSFAAGEHSRFVFPWTTIEVGHLGPDGLRPVIVDNVAER